MERCRCRGAGAEVQRFSRDADVKRCKGITMHIGRGAEVHMCTSGAEVHMCKVQRC